MTKEGDEPFNKKKEEGDKNRDWSEIRLALEELSLVKHDEVVSTLAFLSVSNLLLQVLDKIGPTMAVLRQDIQQNIERLQGLYVLDPSRYSSLAEILKKEVSEGTTRKAESHARAMLWLTRLPRKYSRSPSPPHLKNPKKGYMLKMRAWREIGSQREGTAASDTLVATLLKSLS